ncbi:Mob1/phocein, partial [Pseudomassariella vexata]
MSMPSSSPRLPSPPPPAEIQIGPKSPGLGATANRQAQQMEQNMADANAKRRIHPGTKAEHMAAGPPLVPLNELDSAFQLQEHLAALHYHLSAQNTLPISRQTAVQLATPPPGIDRTLWLYELCRFLIAQCNSLIVGFLFDTPACSQATCPEMRASEWQFLCAVHDQPKSCCAIDYCCHTLDWAAGVVTNPKIFPSRFVVLHEGHDKNAVQKNLVNVFRRLHRIFAHAWFQHRGVFWSVEAQTGLYVFFKTVCDLYDLLPQENYKLPPEAEGLEPATSEKDDSQPKVTQIAKPPARESEGAGHEEDHHSMMARRSNTARHSSRPSVGSAVTTVIEEREDDSSEMA